MLFYEKKIKTWYINLGYIIYNVKKITNFKIVLAFILFVI